MTNTKFPYFFSRLTQAARSQARLCIGISSTEPSLLENAITVYCEIFQIKHWNINKRIITYFMKKGCYWKQTFRAPQYSGSALLARLQRKKIKPRTQSVSNGLDTDHD